MFKINKNNRYLSKIIFITTAILFLPSCGGSKPSEPTKPTPPAYESPKAGQEKYSLLKQEGTKWVNQEGQKVSLRGINLGNWLAMELWMIDSGSNPLGDGIGDQCKLENKLTERFGAEEKNRLLKVFRDHWITTRDWDLIASSGFNLIRLPFLYSLIEDENNPMTLRQDAWEYMDMAIAQAKARKMYVVLDLHGAVGGQGVEQHTGCAGKNELWTNFSYRERTKWLWKEIAKKYKNESAIAGYGLLNEPWGTDGVTLANYSLELYRAIREEDKQHIVILPGHDADGISAYGDPYDSGMTNVAFDIHQYPGLFGFGEIGYQVHRDWLTCGENGTSGVCDWTKRSRAVFTPLLIGETQTWTGLGNLGGPITRATFDKYNDLNWAATVWSYKTTSPAGGLGNGQWGLITNNGDQLLTKAETWSCNNWESTFASACAVPARSTIPYRGSGTKTMYLVIKTGAFNGSDVIYDDIKLTQNSTGNNILLNGNFGSADNWTEVAVWGDPRTYTFDYAAGTFAGSDTGPALRVASAAGNNSLIYQAVQIEGGQSYTLSGKFKDLGATGSDMWAEIYLVPDMPVQWVDVTGRVLPKVDINSSTVTEIEDFFEFFGNMDYVINSSVTNAMTSSERSVLFTKIPSRPENLALVVSSQQVGLTWNSINTNVNGYKIYRSTAPRSGFEAIATTTTSSYIDTSVSADVTYYYYVTAFNETDESYGSRIEASGPTFYTIPGFIEAENYSAAHPGVNTETAGDAGGGFNIGSFEIGRWVEYEVNVPTAGSYSVDYRLASLPGSGGFQVQLNGAVLDTVAVPITGGWQTYVTITQPIQLSAGRSTLRLYSVSNQWNLNWMRFTTVSSQ
jgi:endoglucanase